MGEVKRVNFRGRKAKKAPKRAEAKWGDVLKESVKSSERLLSYSRRPGSGYLAQQRFIDLVIASSKEDEFVTSAWMKVGV